MENKLDNLWFPSAEGAPCLVYTHGKSKSKQIQTICTIEGGNKDCYYCTSVFAANCVYFPNPLYYDGKYYCYNLGEDSLTVLSSCSKLKSFFRYPIWLNMMPQHNRLLGVQEVKGHDWNRFKENNVEIITRYKEQPQEMKEKRAGESRFTELPDHLIYTVSKYMHLFDFWNFRSCCNTCQSAVPAILEHRPKNMHPLFVHLINDSGLCKIIDPSRDDPCYNTFQLSSNLFNIDYSKDGWILISVGSREFVKYFNLFTRVEGDFPYNFENTHYVSIGFSTYPTSPDCVTIAIVDKWDFLHFNVFQHGDEKWRVVRVENSSDIRFCPVTSSPLYLAGSFYILDDKGYLGVLTLVGDDDGKESWRFYSKPHTQDSSFHSIHLVECDGEIYAVFIGEIGKWVQVFKFSLVKEKWFKVTSLGKYSFFISHTSSFSIKTTEFGIQNRIYLSRLKGDDLVFYSLLTGKFHVFGSDQTMDNFFGTKDLMHCFWL